MCNRYTPPEQLDMERFWHFGRGRENRWWEGGDVFPRYPGPFIRRARHDPGYSREAVVGRWGLVPWFVKDLSQFKASTNNARSEDLLKRDSYRDVWRRGQRCIIPATTFDEPNWETGKNVWWRFRRADGDPWGLAGLWNVWRDPKTGEEVESYTMLTINADAHPLMSRMHKPDPKVGPGEQDKRSVIPIELADVDQWLQGTIEQASQLLKLAPVETFDAGPA